MERVPAAQSFLVSEAEAMRFLWRRTWLTAAIFGLAFTTACEEEREPPFDRTDLDFDGVFDTRDKCPRRDETWNNFMDSDGCPDEAPEPPAEVVDVGGKIKFKGGGDVIMPQSFSLLNNLVTVMTEHPESKLRIEGHTDNVGSASSNETLSRKRAEAVRRYLIEKGITETRLTAMGLGSKEPVAPNDTEEGRAKNRRVEFYMTR